MAEHNLEKVNLYDFDKTIYDGDSTVDFYKYCLKHYPKIIIRWPQLAIFSLLFILKIMKKTPFKERFYRFINQIPDVDSAVNNFWDLNKHKIKPWYFKQKNYSDIISSASPDFLLAPICRRQLNIRLIASVVNPKTGLYTGLNNHGEEKVIRLKKEYPNVEINEFYSDSLSDTPLARMSEKAYLVEGDTIKDWPL